MSTSIRNALPSWHVLYTKPHCEAQVEAELKADGRIEVYLPTLPPAVPRRGRPAFRPFFPCYLFARFDFEAVGISQINWTRGMRHLVMFGDIPARVDDSVVQTIRAYLAREYAIDREGKTFRKGDLVIIQTEVKDIEAVFDKRLSSAGRVRVLVQCLERWTAVDVEAVKLRKKVTALVQG